MVIFPRKLIEVDSERPSKATKTRRQRQQEFNQASNIVQETYTRKWMERHGAGKFVQFNDEYNII